MRPKNELLYLHLETPIFQRLYNWTGCFEKYKIGALFWGLNLKLWTRIWDRAQESPAVAEKPARREIMPKISPIQRAYNVVADNTSPSSFV